MRPYARMYIYYEVEEQTKTLFYFHAK